MIDGYATYCAYFRKLAWQHLRLSGSFYVGDSWRLLGAQRSEVVYPALWLERPVIRPQLAADQDSLRLVVEGAFSVVAGVATDDYDRQDAQLQLTQAVAVDLVNRLKRDADLDEFDLMVDSTRLDPLAVLMSDDVHGWRVEFVLITRGWNDCFPAERWALLDGAGQENVPFDPDYSPFVEPAEPAFDCAGTSADFVMFYDAGGRGLLLSDTSTYQPGDRRRDVYYTITDGTETVLVAEYERWVSDQALAALDAGLAWTITQVISTLRGCSSTRVHTYTHNGLTLPPPAAPVRYRSDTAAKAAGLVLGQTYILSADNDYFWPEGSHKQITEP